MQAARTPAAAVAASGHIHVLADKPSPHTLMANLPMSRDSPKPVKSPLRNGVDAE